MYPFWSVNKGKADISARRLVKFLKSEGFGLFQTMNTRVSKNEIFRNKDNILQIHNGSSVKSFLINYVENTEESDLDTDQKVSLSNRECCLDKLITMTDASITNYCQSLTAYSESGLQDSDKIKFFSDDAKSCYIAFKNGVVQITEDSIQLLKKDALKDKGCVWETKVLQHEISVHNDSVASEPNPFKDFVHYALKSNIIPQIENNDRDEGTDNKKYQGQKDAFETAFGYLIHSYQPPDEAKIVVFIDVDSSHERTEGGNGKSLSMEMVTHYRKTAFVDGKSFRKAMNDSARFNFSNVQVDTGFVFINDLNPDFDLTSMFSIITDDMTVEGKGTNKFIISKDKKPKMGITTNYVVTGVGGSFERRQHIVEFGNFWNKCNSLKIKPASIIGKKLVVDFNEEDWIDFYNYGFRCVQKYLKHGLIEQKNAAYKRKTLVASLEGEKGTGEVVQWIDDYIENDRKDHLEDGIALDDLYRSFTKQMINSIVSDWDQKRFTEALFNYVTTDKKLEWNEHLAHKGSSRTERRWRVGARGKQKDFVRIASFDDDMSDINSIKF